MSEFDIYQLENLAEITSSKRIFYSDYVDAGVPFYRSKEIIEIHNNKSVSNELFISKEKFLEISNKFGAPVEGDILLTSVGTLGIPYLVRKGDNFYFKDGNLTWIRKINRTKVLPEYIYRFLRSPYGKSKIEEITIGSTQPALTISGLKTLTLSIPSLVEQQAIVSVLSSLDDKIDLLHRQNKTLESMAETLFRQWFIVEEQEDWEIYSVKDIAHHLKDTITPCKYPNVIFNHHSLPAFDSGNYPESHLGSEILSNKYKVHNKSILVSKLNPGTPRIWLINNASERDICSTEFQNLKPINPEHLEFIYCFFNARSTIENLTMSASGTSGSHQRVKPEDMMNLEFKSPNVEYISAFSEKNKPILNKVLCNRETIKTLNTLRDTLLPKLMSGEVRVEYAYEAIASIE